MGGIYHAAILNIAAASTDDPEKEGLFLMTTGHSLRQSWYGVGASTGKPTTHESLRERSTKGRYNR